MFVENEERERVRVVNELSPVRDGRPRAPASSSHDS